MGLQLQQGMPGHNSTHGLSKQIINNANQSTELRHNHRLLSGLKLAPNLYPRDIQKEREGGEKAGSHKFTYLFEHDEWATTETLENSSVERLEAAECLAAGVFHTGGLDSAISSPDIHGGSDERGLCSS